MKSSLVTYINIDKSTQFLFNESGSFKVFHLNNLSNETEFFKHSLSNNYIQIYFCTANTCKIALNFEHCAFDLMEGNSSMVYFKDDKMDLFFKLPSDSELLAVFISIEYFHSLFSINGTQLFNYSKLKSENPIIEPKEITGNVKLLLNQIISNYTNDPLRPIFIKGKVYELISYYFSTPNKTENESCPYIATEETIGKIKKAKQLIIKEMINPPSLADLAKEIGLNIKKLKTDFKEYYGVPVFTFLLNYKMELAKTLLQEQQLNVNEIASHLGYSTSSHFIAAFKRAYGITPKQFSKT